MAARSFDGTDDVIKVAPPAYFTGAFTWVAIARRDSTGSWYNLFAIGEPGSVTPAVAVIFNDASGLTIEWSTHKVRENSLSWTAPDEWRLYAITYDNSAIHRFHIFNGLTWQHADGVNFAGSYTTDFPDWTSGTAPEIRFGNWSDAFNYFNGEMAMQALNIGTALSDGALEALAGGDKDDYVTAGFDHLWEFNQANTSIPVQDYIGSLDQTALVGTTVVPAGDPPTSVYSYGAGTSTPVLRFDGTDDYLSGTAPGGLNGAFTIAALFKRTSYSTIDALFTTLGTGPSVGISWEVDSDKPIFYNDNAGGMTNGGYTGSLVSNNFDLFFGAITRGSGETPRFHAKRITDPDWPWTHENGTTAQTTNPDAAASSVIVGRFDYPGIGIFDYFSGDIGLIAWWDGVEFTDAQVEELLTNYRTSDWHNHSVGIPTSLTELITATPTDLEGLVTWTNNGATLTGDMPSDWSFDNTEAPAVVTDDILVKVGGTWVATEMKVREGGAWI